MKILITGATGFVGTALTKKLIEDNNTIHILTRDKNKALKKFNSDKVLAFEWNDSTTLPPSEAFSGIDAVIHLMGENIGSKNWSDNQKIKLRQSRVDATKNLVTQINNLKPQTLKVFISASAIGIYPVNGSEIIDEKSSTGNGFLADLCHDWEEASKDLVNVCRRVIVRTGVVLEKNDGALKKMLTPFILGVGGPIGSGKQYMSWIHLDDLTNIYIEALKNEKLNGVYNAVSPFPVSNYDFTKALGKALHRPTIFPVPPMALKLAFGEMSSIILDSQKIIPTNLINSGFKFKYEKIDSALNATFN